MSESALFNFVAAQQGDAPWGAVLDAGAGLHSLGWICSLPTRRWTAVTASKGHHDQIQGRLGGRMRPVDRLVLGDWADPELLAGERFDVVLADYLLGAIDGFAPYFQETLFDRLREVTGGRLYVVGLEPYVVGEPAAPAGRLIWEIGRLRDACLLLAGEMPYREYPAAWTARALERAGFRIVAGKRFPIRYKAGFVNSQLDMCLQRLPRLSDTALAESLANRVEALREQALALLQAENGLRHGYDYVIAAEPV